MGLSFVSQSNVPNTDFDFQKINHTLDNIFLYYSKIKIKCQILIIKILTVAIGYWILNFLVLVKLGSVGLGRRTATFHIWHFRIPLLFGTNFSLGPITAGWTLPSISWFNVDSRRTVVRPEPDDRFTVERFTRFEDWRPEMWDSLKIIIWAYLIQYKLYWDTNLSCVTLDFRFEDRTSTVSWKLTPVGLDGGTDGLPGTSQSWLI